LPESAVAIQSVINKSIIVSILSVYSRASVRVILIARSSTPAKRINVLLLVNVRAMLIAATERVVFKISVLLWLSAKKIPNVQRENVVRY